MGFHHFARSLLENIAITFDDIDTFYQEYIMTQHIQKHDQLIKVGVSPLSWVNEVLDDLGKGTKADQCLSEAKTAGYAGVETSKIFPSDPSELKTLLHKHDLQLISGWYSGFLTEKSVEDEFKDVISHAELLKACGSSVMVYGECGHMAQDALDIPMSHRLTLSLDAWKHYGERLTLFAEKVKSEFDIRIAYHHHLMMVAEKLDEIRTLMNTTGDAVGLLLDTGHAYAGGFNYTDLISEFGSRINHIHLKDVRKNIFKDIKNRDASFNEGVRAGMFTVPGDGMIDYEPLAQFLKNSNYSGWILVEAEQDPAKANPLSMVSSAYQFIRKQILKN
ncbi:Sugar phosphate isomerase/epimerase (YcjR) (PDB:3KTC) (PUBMED:30742415) [Commensalibacter communis]|nr:Sugar phosphate isomerase/epimerase (YcjR) (PDB:3KTC) (PUBMED:30742415) [Commensalibacter communis]CAI3960408.1 Sugar phosphate isomerase/epimerase (YcjR) (PDB:3KTC) (PUBMED:30742415) [Commensalibacter communis]